MRYFSGWWVNVCSRQSRLRMHWHCYRLYKLFPCYVRRIFTLKCVLTFGAFRLNNRDSLRERSSHRDMSNVFQFSSTPPRKPSFKPGTRPTAVAVTMHQTATADFARNMHDYDNEPELDKPVWVLHNLWRSGTEMFLKEGLTISVKEGPPGSNVLGLGQVMTTV